MAFEGFSTRTVEFLIENRLRNSKPWFEENRGQYEALVLRPMRELVEALAPTMLDIDPEFTVEPKVGRTISRIFRDVRRVRDGFLFRDGMWIAFMRHKRCWEGQPGFYFGFGPDGLDYGYGYYQAATAAMETMRGMILRKEPLFAQALAAYTKQQHAVLHGDRYKRSRFPDEPPERRDWLERRSISFDGRLEEPEVFYTPQLAPLLAERFRELVPLHAFFNAVEERRPHRQPAATPETTGIVKGREDQWN